MGWVLFSAVILVVMGWGTTENGLILYALYFSWAFSCLLFQLVEKAEEKLRIPYLLPVLSVAGIAAILAVNLPAILELIRFAVAYYPS